MGAKGTTPFQVQFDDLLKLALEGSGVRILTRLAMAIVLVSAVALHGQTARPSPASTARTGSIRGRVLAAKTDTPLPNARIEIEDDARRVVSTVLADGEGRFAISSLGVGVYTLTVSKPGYVKTSVVSDAANAGRANRTSIRVPEGGTLSGVDVRMVKAGAIAGRILDGFGEPIIGVSVTADSVGDNGRTSARGETDDLGQYRIGGLPAGRFIVSVDAPAAVLFSRPVDVLVRGVGARGGRLRLYYPGTDDASQAQPIDVLESEERSNIDFGVPFLQLTNDVTIGDVHATGNITIVGGGGSLVALPTPANDRPPDRDATGEISGRILRSDGRPLARAQVRLELADPNRAGRGTLTDDDGRYEFTAIRAGDYTLTASRRGYLDVEYGQTQAFERGAEIKLSAGQKRERADIVLPRQGAIAGHVLDESGEPVEGARVSVLQIRYTAGRQQLIEPQAAKKWTDDVGSYRVHDLQPGQYLVQASFADSSDHSRPTLDIPGYAPTYYPGTPTPANARLVTVGISQEISGLDFAMARVPTARISGHAFTSSGESVKGGLSLTPSLRSGSIASTPVGPDRLFAPDGSFEFRNVPPGEYVIQATMGRPTRAAEGEFAAQYVVVNGMDIDNLVLRTSPGSTISGHVTFEADNPPTRPEIGLRPVAVDPDLNPRIGDAGPFGAGPSGRADVHDDWTFEIAGISGMRRLRLTDPPAGWMLKAIDLNGADVTDQTFTLGRQDQSVHDLQVVLTNQVTVIEGLVADASGRPVRDCLVVAFPVDRAARLYPSRFLDHSVCQRDGSFVIRRLPPGEYLVAAVGRRSNEMPDEWQDPQLLELITPGATRLVLAEGQRVAVRPRLIAR